MNKIKPKLFRRRFIPDELVYLKDDEILSLDKNLIITKWNVLKPRHDFSHGYSCYFINKGIKVSKFLDNDENLVYYYCDIIKSEYNQAENSYIFSDLLIDVIVCPNGFVKVMDIGEVTDALDKDLITVDDAKAALSQLDELLKIIYANKFDTLTHFIDTAHDTEKTKGVQYEK